MNNKRNNRYRDPRFIGTLLLGVIIIFMMVVSSFVDTGSVIVTTVTPADISVSTPIPTVFRLPTLEPDGPQITLGDPLIHRNGLFQVTAPVGWTGQQNNFDPNTPEARLQLNNGDRLSVIDFILQLGVNYASHESLSADLFDQDYFATAWQQYLKAEETSRTVGESIVINFDLNVDNIDFLGRQVAWLDGDWLHTIRYVVPANYPALLDALQSQVTDTFISYDDQRGKSYTLSAYSDFQQGFLIRHPGWGQVSGMAGTPAVFEDFSGTTRLLLRQYPDTTLDTLESADTFVRETLHSGAVINSSQVTNREFSEGYMVSYGHQDSEGNTYSGLVALLNRDGALLVADVQLSRADIDLLSVSNDGQAQQIRDVLNTFSVLPPADYRQAPAENPPIVLEVETQATAEADATPE